MSILNRTLMLYEHVVIDLAIVTLNNDSVMLTFYPNFNMLLKYSNLSFAFQIQV